MEVVLMELLASCSLEQARGFNGKLVIPNEDSKRPDKVFLNVEYTESNGTTTEFFEKVSTLDRSLVKCVSFPEGYAGVVVPDDWKGRVFVYSSLDNVVQNPNFPESEGVITLIRLNEDYPCDKYKPNLRDLVSVCSKFDSVRFLGGTLLGVEGLKIGRFEEGKDKMSPIFKDIYDTFVEVRLDDLNGLTEIVKKTRKKAERNEKDKKPKVMKAKKPKKQLEAFKNLFGDEEEEEF